MEPMDMPQARREELRADPSRIPVLTSDQWTRWLDDEARLDTPPPVLAALFARAVELCPSFDVWIRYCTFLATCVDDYLEVLAEAPESADDVRPPLAWPGACLAAVARAADMHQAHFTRGHELWAILLHLTRRSGASDETIRQLYHDRLWIPGPHLNDTMTEYTRFESQVAARSEDTAHSFESHLAAANARFQEALAYAAEWQTAYEAPLAAAVAAGDDTTGTVHMYLRAVSAVLPQRAVAGFLERAVAELAPTPSSRTCLWATYAHWAKVADPPLDPATVHCVLRRAVAACPTAREIGMHLLRALDDPADVVAEAQRAVDVAKSVEAADRILVEAILCLRRCYRAGSTAPSSASLADRVMTLVAARSERFGDVPSSDFSLEPAIVEALLATSGSASAGAVADAVDAAIQRLRDAPCAVAAPWLRIARALIAQAAESNDIAQHRIRSVFESAQAAVTDDPRAVLAAWREWELVDGSLRQVETLHSQLEVMDQYYSDYYASATAGAASTAAGSSPAGEEAVAVQSETKTKAKRKRAADEGEGEGDAASREHAAKKPRSVDAPDAAARQAKLDRTLVVKHVVPANEGALRLLLEPLGAIQEIRFPPTAASSSPPADGSGSGSSSGGEQTQAFILFRQQESLVEVFRFRHSLRLAGSGDRPLQLEMAVGAQFDPLAVLRAEKEAAVARIAAEKEVKHAVFAAADADRRTLFVANLGKRVTEDEVRAAFASTTGGAGDGDEAVVVDVRLMRTKFGESKGFGYVEMATSDAARAAVAALDGTVLGEGGRAMSVALSDPAKRKSEGPSATRSTASPLAQAAAAVAGHPTQSSSDASSGPNSAEPAVPVVAGTRVRDYDPRVLFVANLAFSATEAAVRALFAQHGTVTDLRLPRDPAGKPRGIAFVTFADESAAAAAVASLDKHAFEGRPLSVSVARATRAGGAAGEHQAARIRADQHARADREAERTLRAAAVAKHRDARAEADKAAARAACKVFVRGLPVPAAVGADGSEAKAAADPVDWSRYVEGELTSVFVRDDGSRILTFGSDRHAAAAAALALNGREVGGYRLHAEVKRPPGSGSAVTKAATATGSAAVPVPAAPSAATAVPVPAHAKAKPKRRVVVAAAPKPSAATTTDSSAAAPKGNAFFRDLYLSGSNDDGDRV
ncbi:Splicing factor [Blastocladiella emersonii ATCC 22665]|nr:Splicing factor [Blastocladiella emersonii ATCC 22665]